MTLRHGLRNDGDLGAFGAIAAIEIAAAKQGNAEDLVFFFNDTAPPEIYTLSLHDALPISLAQATGSYAKGVAMMNAEAHRLQADDTVRSEEHTSELQSLAYLVCRLLL